MEHKEYRLAAIMFTDIVGFSRMMEQNEKATLELLEYHNGIVRKHTEELRGSIIKTIGDAFLIDFPNTVNAVNCAVRIQKDLEERNRSKPDFPLVLRIGVHLGDIYFYENDALGEGINIASRLQSICNPGRVCISQDVYNLVNNKIEEIPIKELGDVKLKNISREIRAYEILTNGKGTPVEEAAEKHDAGLDELKEAAAKVEEQSSETHSGGTGASPGLSESEIKSRVMSEIKKAGRRLSIDEVKPRIPGESADIDRVLSDMVKKGFLAPASARTSTFAGSAGPGSGTQSQNGPDPKEFPYNLHRSAGEFGKIGREIVHEIGREFERGRARARSRMADSQPRFQFREDNQDRYLPIPQQRGFGGDEKQDKALEKAWDRVLDTPYDTWQDQQLIQEYRAQTMKSLRKMEAGYRGHLGSFFSVNAVITTIWALTSFGGHPWFFYPLGGWGIGMASHTSALRLKRREARELQALPALNKGQLRKLRKLQRNRSGFFGHLVSTAATSLFLIGINLITSPMVPWSLIATGAMAIGVFSHLPGYKSKEHRLLGELEEMGISTKVLRGSRRLKLSDQTQIPNSHQSPMEAEARNLKAAVMAQVAGMKDRSSLGDDFESVLDNYVAQISTLSRKDEEINRTLQAIPMTNLEGELLDLQKHRDATGNPDLIVELEKSIESIKKQQSSYYELQNQQQILKVKITSAINSLRQLQLDLVKMKRTPDLDELPPIDHLRSEAGEINHYLSDLESEYRRLEAMEEDLKN